VILFFFSSSAHFDERESHFSDIKVAGVRLNSSALLNSMVEQARMVVLKTVASATKTQVPTQVLNTVSENSGAPPDALMTSASNAALSRFRSQLNLTGSPYTAADQDTTPRLQKARSSALRLNSVLHHRPVSDNPAAGSLGMRKTRSVKWDNPIHPPKLGGALAPAPKKPRRAINAAKLKSFKSFGRAHAEDFNAGPRNATFGTFEHHQIWGRNGRVAHHPRPSQAGHGDFMGHTNIAANNATFDLSGGLGRSNTHTMQAGSPRLSFPRTTTALEMFVLKKSTSEGKPMI
jgi:hypothetical protein